MESAAAGERYQGSKIQLQNGLHVAALSDVHLLTQDQDACSQKSHSADIVTSDIGLRACRSSPVLLSGVCTMATLHISS